MLTWPACYKLAFVNCERPPGVIFKLPPPPPSASSAVSRQRATGLSFLLILFGEMGISSVCSKKIDRSIVFSQTQHALVQYQQTSF